MVHRNGRFAWTLVLLASVPVASRADVVLEWNEIMLATLVGQSPANEARLAAITQLAVFEAVNAISGEYRPYLRTIKAPRGASADAAVVAAAHATLVHFVPARIEELDRARVRSLRGILDGPAKRDGIAVGEAAARALIELREDDGSAANEPYLPTSSNPGDWQLTGGCPISGGVFLRWQDVVPFGIKRSGQFRVAPPPALRSDEYAASYNELRKVGGLHSSERPQDRADVARFYAAVLTIGTWNPVASQVAAAQGRSLSENARALALLNIALSDALVAVFKAKYRDPFWRPETAIPAGGRDRNPGTPADPEFAPFVPTPCHPSYPSAHASAAYAAREILERIYGRKNHLINLSNTLVPGVSLQYRRFDEITADIDDARVFGGIHFRFDQEAGASLGCRVGRYIYRHHLRPTNDHTHDDGRGKDCPR